MKMMTLFSQHLSLGLQNDDRGRGGIEWAYQI